MGYLRCYLYFNGAEFAIYLSVVVIKSLFFLILVIVPFFGFATDCKQSLMDGYSHYFEFKNYQDRTSPYHDSNIVIVNVAEIEGLHSIKNQSGYGGYNHQDILVGTFQNRKVFIKIFKGLSDTRGMFEIKYTKLLADLGLGPYFFGVIKKNGYPIGVVTEFIEGHIEKHEYMRGKQREKSNVIRHFLLDVGILPHDLQYRQDHDGRLWVIDTGAFQFFGDTGISKTDLELSLDKAAKALNQSEPKKPFFENFFKRWL